MKICFVNPRIPPAAMNFHFAMDLVGTRFSHIPLPLLTLAALTPPDIEVEVLDENVTPIDPDTIRADVVAFTGIFCQRPRLFALADALRRRGVIVVIGGPIVEDLPAECRAHADVLFEGEAEYTWPRFCAEVRSGQHAERYEEQGTVDMATDSPIPRFDLVDVRAYASGCIQATRGCPYRCEYCDVPKKNGQRPRSKSVPQVLEEIRRLVALGCDSIFFVDDHFAGNRKYARELLRAIRDLLPALPIPVYFYTQITLNVAKDEELLELLHAAGFRRLFIGVETPDRGKLAALEKHHNLELPIEDAIAKIQSYNITVWAGIMVGLDHDDEASVAAQLAFIQRTALMPTLISVLQALPKAPMFDRVVSEGRLRVLPDHVGSGAFGSVEAMRTTNLSPVGSTVPGVLENFATLVRGIFDADAYGDRLLASIGRGRRPHPSIGGALSRRNLAIVRRTVKFYLEVKEPAMRRLFWRVMRFAAVRRGQGLEELLYHLVIYKHLRTFYLGAANEAEAEALREAA